MTLFEKTSTLMVTLETQKFQGHTQRMTVAQVNDYNDGIQQAIELIQIAVDESNGNARTLKAKLQTVYNILTDTEDENVYRDTSTRKAVSLLLKVLK